MDRSRWAAKAGGERLPGWSAASPSDATSMEWRRSGKTGQPVWRARLRPAQQTRRGVAKQGRRTSTATRALNLPAARRGAPGWEYRKPPRPSRQASPRQRGSTSARTHSQQPPRGAPGTEAGGHRGSESAQDRQASRSQPRQSEHPRGNAPPQRSRPFQQPTRGKPGRGDPLGRPDRGVLWTGAGGLRASSLTVGRASVRSTDSVTYPVAGWPGGYLPVSGPLCTTWSRAGAWDRRAGA